MTDKKLFKLVKDFREGILDGSPPKYCCYIVSSPLSSYLEFCGVKNKLVEGTIIFEWDEYSHYWIELPDGRIIDPTASQFLSDEGEPMPEVYIGSKPSWYVTIINAPLPTFTLL